MLGAAQQTQAASLFLQFVQTAGRVQTGVRRPSLRAAARPKTSRLARGNRVAVRRIGARGTEGRPEPVSSGLTGKDVVKGCQESDMPRKVCKTSSNSGIRWSGTLRVWTEGGRRQNDCHGSTLTDIAGDVDAAAVLFNNFVRQR